MQDLPDNFKGKGHVTRRTFLRQVGLTGVGLTIGCTWPVPGTLRGEVVSVKVSNSEVELMTWISILPSGQVILFNHRSEMGQGTWQSIPQIVAEELEISMDRVVVRAAPANPEKYGPQPQEGSFSIRGWYDQLLRMGATAREMLTTAAATQWGADKSECFAADGEVIHQASGKKLSYGALAERAAKLEPPQQVTLKARQDYKLIGQPLPRHDVPLKVNGTAVFGLDHKLPGMLYAVVERSPRLRGKVAVINDTETLAVAGVKRVLKVPRYIFGVEFEGVAVVATSLWAAMQGRKRLNVTWNDDGFEHLSSEDIVTRMHADLNKPAASEKFDHALRSCQSQTEAIYELPYQSHSCMEPLNCTADVRGDTIEVWGPVQEANWIQADLSDRFGIPRSQVKVNMTFLGGGFGRKAFPDYPYEAAWLSKELKAPVQLMCTREDDMTMGPFRSGAVYRCRGGVDVKGKISAFQVITVTQNIGPGQTEDAKPQPLSDNQGGIAGWLSDYPKTIPNTSFAWMPTKSPIPILWWRAPIANVDAFAGECFMDELAHLALQDPVEFRKAHLKEPRYLALIEKLATVSQWKKPTAPHQSSGSNHKKAEGWGIAVTDCFGSAVGQVVKVARRPDQKIAIEKVYAVIDCGRFVNPDIIRAQLEGSIVMAMGASLFHATHFNNGRAVEQNFNTYRMPRINNIPDIEVHIMENDEKPGGVGEPGLPAFAPALANAIFDLTGTRIRKLPFALDAL